MEWIDFKKEQPLIVLDENVENSDSKEVVVLFANGEVYKAKFSHWYEDDFLLENFFFYHTDSGEHIDSMVTHWFYFEKPD